MLSLNLRKFSLVILVIGLFANKVHGRAICLQGMNTLSSNAALGAYLKASIQGRSIEDNEPVFAKWLGCLNRLKYPFWDFANPSPDGSDVTSKFSAEGRTAVFFEKRNDKDGFYVIRPNSGHRSDMLGIENNSGRKFNFSVKRSDGSDAQFSFGYNNSDGSSPWSGGGVTLSPTASEVGTNNEKISNRDAADAVRREVLRRLDDAMSETRKKELQAYIVSGEKQKAIVDETLCACIKTEDPAVVPQARALSIELNLGDQDSCGPALISRHPANSTKSKLHASGF